MSNEEFDYILKRWHMAQAYAAFGDYKFALSLMRKAVRPDDECWNLYVGATIAFLEGDRETFDSLVIDMKKNGGGLCEANLPVVERLAEGWGKPYGEVY